MRQLNDAAMMGVAKRATVKPTFMEVKNVPVAKFTWSGLTRYIAAARPGMKIKRRTDADHGAIKQH